MSLLEALRADRSKPGAGCRFCAWLRSRPPAEQAEWVIAMKDDTISMASMFRYARDNGYVNSKGSVMNHRRDRH